MFRRPMPERLAGKAAAQDGLLARGQVLDAEMSPRQIQNRLEHGVWRRVTRGVYEVLATDSAVDPYILARRRAAWIGVLAAHPIGISPGACALALQGFWGLPQSLAPEVALPRGRYSIGAPEVKVRRFDRSMRWIRLGEHRVAAPISALTQALPELDRDSAVAVLDSALNRGLLTHRDVLAVRRNVRGRRGAARLHQWWPLIDSGAQSPLETHARLRCLDAGLPEPTVQAVVRSPGGRIIARGDLGWRRSDGSWLLLELDGRGVHGRPEALYRDRSRQNAIALAGDHTLLRFTGVEVFNGAMVRAARAALAAPSPRRPGAERSSGNP